MLPIAGSETTTYLFMGDRWAHPRQNSAATCVWQPLEFAPDGALSLPAFHPAWRVDLAAGRWSAAPLAGKLVSILDYAPAARSAEGWTPHADAQGFSDLRSKVKGAALTLPFTGTQVGLHAVARPDGGFGRIDIKDARGRLVLSSIIETYCLYPEASLKFLSPRLPRGDYTLTLTVLGERFFWQAKTAAYGSRGDYVSAQKIAVVD